MHKPLLLVLFTVLALSAKAQTAARYVPGYYFDNEGKKFTGTMKFNAFSDWFFFKAQPGPLSEKIRIEQVRAVVANGDSVTVMTEDNKASRKYFATFRMATPFTRFYYKHKQPSGFRLSGNPELYRGAGGTLLMPQSTQKTDDIKNILMYQDGDTTFELTKHNYIEVLSKVLADVPEVVKLVQDKELKFKDIDEIFSRYYVKTKYSEQ